MVKIATSLGELLAFVTDGFNTPALDYFLLFTFAVNHVLSRLDTAIVCISASLNYLSLLSGSTSVRRGMT